MDAYTTLRKELADILTRFEAADQRARQAIVSGDRSEAEAAALEATGEHWEASREVADLLLLLLRHAMRHRREILREWVLRLVQPELEEVTNWIAELERKRQ